jgi:glutathione synthase/RimK-type ligase-like ATP-grasp enzyme
MYVAIHKRKGGYAQKWIEFCNRENIPFKEVDCYSSNIISELENVTHLLWHYHRWEIKNGSVATKLLSVFEQMGIKVFPNLPTRLSFDEKIIQKYLLESIGAPIPETTVFFEKEKALNWLKSKKQLVFKLSKGAGSKNVQLVNATKANRLINKMFGNGMDSFKPNIPKYKKGFLYSLKRYLVFRKPLAKHQNKLVGREYGYAYFQEFLPNNDHDIRILTFRNKAVGIRRAVRENSFKASGSGFISYKKEDIPLECIEKAFEVSAKLNFQFMAYDFVLDSNQGYKIVEICHGVAARSYEKCEGFWNKNLEFIALANPIIIEDEIIRDLLMPHEI